MTNETKTLNQSIENGWRSIKANQKVLNSVCPNMKGEQKENIYNATKSLIENIIEDFEQLKIDIQPKDKPLNKAGEGEKIKKFEQTGKELVDEFDKKFQ